MTDPYREASKYNTAVKRVDKWQAARVKQIESQAVEKLTALWAGLSDAAKRVIAAARWEDNRATAADLESAAIDVSDPAVQQVIAEAEHSFDDSAMPDWLNALPEGAPAQVVEHPDRKRRNG